MLGAWKSVPDIITPEYHYYRKTRFKTHLFKWSFFTCIDVFFNNNDSYMLHYILYYTIIIFFCS